MQEVNLTFEKYQEQDFDLYYQLVGNEAVMAMITERAIPIEEAMDNFQSILTDNDRYQKFGSYKVFTKDTHTYIGFAKLEVKNHDATEAELGYMLLPEYWGKGFGTSIAELLINKAKTLPRLKTVTAIIDPNNVPSKKILTKLGFVTAKVCEIDGLPGEILTYQTI
ncbi:GNAT family N-acetyltransferase [Amphibacillus sediminis]|uniref:GNAT family N-acetyltransferase n=1 Tax=Amphibacillus sediminis TaxID=360185 RepID=UPI00082C76B7|nr:GNAT family N-acetyltransferase [Amphibacillus sediminis]